MFVLGSFGAYGLCVDKPADKLLLVDVRTERKWKEGHLEGAILVPYDKFEESITKIAPDKTTKI